MDGVCGECGKRIYLVEPIDGVPEVDVWCHYAPMLGEDSHEIIPTDVVKRLSVEEQMAATAAEMADVELGGEA